MILQLQQRRRSIRTFLPRPIPESLVEEMLEVARLAPSGGNEQPWAFGVVRDRDLISGVAALSYGQDWIGEAPLLMVLCTRIVDDSRGARQIQIDRFPDHRRR